MPSLATDMAVTVVSTSPYVAMFSDAGFPNGPVIQLQPTDWVGSYGSPATFTVGALSGDGSPLTYQWQEFTAQWDDLVDGAPISGATTETLSIANAQAIDNGRQFRVSVSNDVGSAFSSTVTIIGSP